MNTDQLEKMASAPGFLAALDQSGGSTPKALERYGLDASAYADEATMFDLVHEMRTRIMTSPVFTGDRILATILFEMTMDRQVEGMGTAEHLWERKRIVPILKIDKGLAPETDGVRTMNPIPDLDATLTRARPGSGPSWHSSSGWRSRCSHTAWCRSSNPRSTSTPPRRQRQRTCCARPSSVSSTCSAPTSR